MSLFLLYLPTLLKVTHPAVKQRSVTSADIFGLCYMLLKQSLYETLYLVWKILRDSYFNEKSYTLLVECLLHPGYTCSMASLCLGIGVFEQVFYV